MASQGEAAFVVECTFRSNALVVGITGETVLAIAATFVVAVDLTERIYSTLSYQAGVDALVVDARLSKRTLVVATTAD